MPKVLRVVNNHQDVRESMIGGVSSGEPARDLGLRWERPMLTPEAGTLTDSRTNAGKFRRRPTAYQSVSHPRSSLDPWSIRHAALQSDGNTPRFNLTFRMPSRMIWSYCWPGSFISAGNCIHCPRSKRSWNVARAHISSLLSTI
jgi:hypothetical protein